jgi:hypothetical protein
MRAEGGNADADVVSAPGIVTTSPRLIFGPDDYMQRLAGGNREKEITARSGGDELRHVLGAENVLAGPDGVSLGPTDPSQASAIKKNVKGLVFGVSDQGRVCVRRCNVLPVIVAVVAARRKQKDKE